MAATHYRLRVLSQLNSSLLLLQFLCVRLCVREVSVCVWQSGRRRKNNPCAELPVLLPDGLQRYVCHREAVLNSVKMEEPTKETELLLEDDTMAEGGEEVSLVPVLVSLE